VRCKEALSMWSTGACTFDGEGEPVKTSNEMGEAGSWGRVRRRCVANEWRWLMGSRPCRRDGCGASTA